MNNRNIKLLEALKAGLDVMQVNVTDGQCDQLIAYLELLVEWNQRMNLSGHKDAETMVSYHLLDSLSLLPYLKGSRVCDVGTGAGLPGIPLSIARPDLTFCLLDARLKRTQFVRHVCWQLGLNLTTVVESRMESFSDELGFDTIVARAVADASTLVQQSTHLLSTTGQWSLMKGVVSSEEEAGIGRHHELIEVHVPGIDHPRHVIVIPNEGECFGEDNRSS